LAYGRLILHPDLHIACPENDIWNLPIRWSVLSALRQGLIPLWEPHLAFGSPWLATWQTETFYPGTLLFTWLGLDAWNLSGVLHLLIFSLGVYFFLRSSDAKPFGAFLAAALAPLTPWAYNHLGSNSPMDTLAWAPWVFYGLHERLHGRPHGALKLSAFLSLQILAGYPQITLYTGLGCLLFVTYHKSWAAWRGLALASTGALLVTAAQWLPSAEYFLFNSVRLPAVPSDPDFILPLENLKTLWDPQALSSGGIVDYVRSPTFFFFNLYAGWVPLAFLAWGLTRLKKLGPESRFFMLAFAACLLWAFVPFSGLFHLLHLPFPAVLEPAKSWALGNVMELFAVGFLASDLLPKVGARKWVLAAAILNLLYPIWVHPVERNLLPGDPALEAQAAELKGHLGSGRLLVLADNETYGGIHSPLPIHEKEALFKHFTPNSNLYNFIPVANFNGSTLPSWGALDAGFYFKYCFPYPNSSLMDLLGVDLLLLPIDPMPSHFQKLGKDGAWTLWKNPGSLGGHFLFIGAIRSASRKEAFQAFASEKAKPLEDLFLDPLPFSQAPRHDPSNNRVSDEFFNLSENKEGYLVVTQNASPGWRSWMDGKPSPVFLADGIFQAVPVSRDSHQVRLAYEPASFRLGLFVSLLALAGFITKLGLKRIPR